MSFRQSPATTDLRSEYRRAFVLPKEALPSEVRGDRLVQSIADLEGSQPDGWEVVRVKLSTDDRGRSWIDVLLKRPVQAEQAETGPAGKTAVESLRVLRAA